MIKIVIADDHAVVREGLRLLLEAESGYSVAGEAADGFEAVELVRRCGPDIVLLAISMPRLNGIEACAQIARQAPRTRILMLTMYEDEAHVLAAFRSGAHGYMLKQEPAGHLVHAIRCVLAGKRYLSPPLAERALNSYVQRASVSLVDSFDTLTTREREILQLTAEGFARSAVAALLSISPRTVESHRANMMRKLHLHNQAEVVRYAIERGVVGSAGLYGRESQAAGA